MQLFPDIYYKLLAKYIAHISTQTYIVLYYSYLHLL